MGDRRKCQTFAASPAEPGGLSVMLELKAKEIIGIIMFAPSIWTLEIDGNLPKIRQSSPRSRTSLKVVWVGVARQVDLTNPTERLLERGQLECRCSER